MLHISSLDSKYFPFSDTNPIEVVHDSDVGSDADNDGLDDFPDINDDHDVDLEE